MNQSIMRPTAPAAGRFVRIDQRSTYEGDEIVRVLAVHDDQAAAEAEFYATHIKTVLDRNTYANLDSSYILVYVDDVVAALERRWKLIAPVGGGAPSQDDIDKHAAHIGPELMEQYSAFLVGRDKYLEKQREAAGRRV